MRTYIFAGDIALATFTLYSETPVVEEVVANSDESDTQSAPETPSDLSCASSAPQVLAPTTVTVATQVSSTGASEIISSSSTCGASTPVPNSTPGTTNSSSATPPMAESNEEKVTPYFHSILQQVAEGGTGGEAASTNAQRVTINMRTFKVTLPESELLLHTAPPFLKLNCNDMQSSALL